MSTSPERAPAVVTPGNHDGVHLGHRALVDTARGLAAERGLRTVAMFFDPHPTRLLAPERAPTLITEPDRRVGLLAEAGVDEALVLPFDEGFAKLSPREFVEQVLVGSCGAKAVVTGLDFHFGHKRGGNIDTLRELGEEYGYEVIVVPPVMVDGEVSSSTRIRAALSAGRVDEATRLLTRVHDVEGTVVHGQARGRTIGFPTANLDLPDVILPADGVYAVVARRLDEDGAPMLGGVANLGVRPTVGAGRSVEVHLFDFEGDLYGATLRVGFVSRIREERAFDGVEALVAQIKLDADAARARLADPSEADLEAWRWLRTR